MKTQDVMTEAVRSCRPETNLAEAVRMMSEGDCGTLPVIEDSGQVIGMITDRDIAIAAGTRNQRPAEIQVREAMSQTVYSSAPDEDIHTALKTMRREKVHRLPVVNDAGGIEGLLSLNDVALKAEKFDGHKTTDLSYDDVVRTLKAVCEHRHPKVVSEVHAAVH
jgi:CBS domain-containing protein